MARLVVRRGPGEWQCTWRGLDRESCISRKPFPGPASHGPTQTSDAVTFAQRGPPSVFSQRSSPQ
eukprot:8939877-Pyramimonas_sp.AAC.1